MWTDDGDCWLHFRFFDHPVWIVVFKKNSEEIFHFFSQDFSGGTNIFSSVNWCLEYFFWLKLEVRVLI